MRSNPTIKRTKVVKLRLTPGEHRTLIVLARPEASVSALIRKQVFGRRFDTVLCVAGVHSTVLQIARCLSRDRDTMSLVLVLAHFVAIERHLQELLTRK